MNNQFELKMHEETYAVHALFVVVLIVGTDLSFSTEDYLCLINFKTMKQATADQRKGYLSQLRQKQIKMFKM